MPPLSLAILASVLHMQGADATITSDNKGVDDLLTNIRSELQEQVDPNAPQIIEAMYNKNYTKGTYHKTNYGKSTYEKSYDKYNVRRSNPALSPGGISTKQTGGSRR